MLRDKIITKEEVTQGEFERMKALRNANALQNIRDDELLDFYVEWNNICYLLKRKRGKKQC